MVATTQLDAPHTCNRGLSAVAQLNEEIAQATSPEQTDGCCLAGSEVLLLLLTTAGPRCC